MKRRRGVGGVNVNLGGKVNLGEVQARCEGTWQSPQMSSPQSAGQPRLTASSPACVISLFPSR